MRMIGWWGLLFALMTGIVTSSLSYWQQRPIVNDNYWMYFSSFNTTSNYLDFYRTLPQIGKVQNLTQTNNKHEYASSFDRYENTIVIIVRDTLLYTESANLLDLDNLSTINLFKPTSYVLSHNQYRGWSNRGKLLFSVENKDNQTQSFGVIDRHSKVTMLANPPLPCTQDNPHAVRRVFEPIWSWDKEWIYYGEVFCNAEGVTYRVRPDGSELQPIMDGYGKLWWTPDGQWIIASVGSKNGFNIVRLRPDGSQFHVLSEDHFYKIVGVPDINWLYLQSGSSLYRMKLDDATLELLEENINFYNKFIFTEHWVYFHKEGLADHGIYRVNLTTFQRDFILDSYTATLIDVSPDDRWLYFYSGSVDESAITYQVELNTLHIQPCQLCPKNQPTTFWIPRPHFPWHAERLTLGAILLGLIGLILQRRIR